jgi:hypothetical protein
MKMTSLIATTGLEERTRNQHFHNQVHHYINEESGPPFKL